MTENDTVMNVETVWHNRYGPNWNVNDYSDSIPCYSDLDESDSNERLPLGAFRPTPEEEEWTIVGKAHDVSRNAENIVCDRLYVASDKLDRSGMCRKQLDYIDENVTRYDSERLISDRRVTKVNMLNTVDSNTRSEVLPIRRHEATQNDSSPSRNRDGPQSHRFTSEPVLTSVRPIIRKRPNVIAVETRKAASGPFPERCFRRNRRLFQQKWPKRPIPRVLQMNSTLTTIRTL